MRTDATRTAFCARAHLYAEHDPANVDRLRRRVAETEISPRDPVWAELATGRVPVDLQPARKRARVAPGNDDVRCAAFLDWFQKEYDFSLRRPVDPAYYCQVRDVRYRWLATLRSRPAQMVLSQNDVISFLSQLGIVPFVKRSYGLTGRNFIVAWLRDLSLPIPDTFVNNVTS